MALVIPQIWVMITYVYLFLNESDTPATERLVPGFIGMVMMFCLGVMAVAATSNYERLQALIHDLQTKVFGKNHAEGSNSRNSTGLLSAEEMV